MFCVQGRLVHSITTTMPAFFTIGPRNNVPARGDVNRARDVVHAEIPPAARHLPWSHSAYPHVVQIRRVPFLHSRRGDAGVSRDVPKPRVVRTEYIDICKVRLRRLGISDRGAYDIVYVVLPSAYHDSG